MFDFLCFWSPQVGWNHGVEFCGVDIVSLLIPCALSLATLLEGGGGEMSGVPRVIACCVSSLEQMTPWSLEPGLGLITASENWLQLYMVGCIVVVPDLVAKKFTR